MTSRWPGWVDAGWIALWTVLSATWCITAATRLGATFDEPYFLSAGLECWRTGTAKSLLDTGTMPLPMVVCTAPLHAYEQWSGRQLDPTRDMDLMLTVARVAALVFWLPLLLYAWVA